MITFNSILFESDLNFEKNKDLYPIIKKMGKFQGSRLLESIQSEMNLNELLYQSLTHDQLKTKFKGIKSIVEVDYDSTMKGNPGGVEITFEPGVSLQGIVVQMNAWGWFPSFIYFWNRTKKYSSVSDQMLIQNTEPFRVRFEAKYDNKVNLDYLDYIYHITTDLQYKKIKHIGLTPKSQSKIADHPSRIYFLTDNNSDTVEETAIALTTTYKNKDRVRSIIVLKIDCNYLKDHKFYEDPNFFIDEAIWTNQNIPPVAIAVDQTINLHLS